MAEKKLQLIALTGLPFAGKTTFAEELLIRKPNTKHHSSTQVSRDLKLPTSVKFLDDEQRARLIAEHNARAIASLEAGKHVIHDGANLTRERRKRIRTIATEHGAEPIVIFVDTPWKTIVARWEVNKTKPRDKQRSNPELELLEEIHSHFERPTSDEPHIIFDSTQETLPAWMQRHAVLLGLQA